MIDHTRCLRATWHPYDPTPSGPLPDIGEWRCGACGIRLGIMHSGLVVRFDPPMVRLPRRDGLEVYGLDTRTLDRQHTTRRKLGKAGFDARFGPCIVYCPRAGVCGRLQHLHPEDASASV